MSTNKKNSEAKRRSPRLSRKPIAISLEELEEEKNFLASLSSKVEVHSGHTPEAAASTSTAQPTVRGPAPQPGAGLTPEVKGRFLNMLNSVTLDDNSETQSQSTDFESENMDMDDSAARVACDDVPMRRDERIPRVAQEEDQPVDLPMYPPIFRNQRTVYEMRNELIMNNGINYRLRLNHENHCSVSFSADTTQEKMWDAFLLGENPYSGGGHTEREEGPFGNVQYHFATEHLEEFESELPLENDWHENYTEDDIPADNSPAIVVNPFAVGKLNRHSIRDVRRIIAAPPPQQHEGLINGGVVFYPPCRELAAIRRSAKKEERAILFSDELPTQLRKPYALKKIADQGILIITNRLEDIHPEHTIIFHSSKLNFLYSYRRICGRKLQNCQKLMRQYDCILRTCRHVLNADMPTRFIGRLQALLANELPLEPGGDVANV